MQNFNFLFMKMLNRKWIDHGTVSVCHESSTKIISMSPWIRLVCFICIFYLFALIKKWNWCAMFPINSIRSDGLLRLDVVWYFLRYNSLFLKFIMNVLCCNFCFALMKTRAINWIASLQWTKCINKWFDFCSFYSLLNDWIDLDLIDLMEI